MTTLQCVDSRLSASVVGTDAHVLHIIACNCLFIEYAAPLHPCIRKHPHPMQEAHSDVHQAGEAAVQPDSTSSSGAEVRHA
jgi:hypothetical protein